LLPDTTCSYVEKLQAHYINQNFPKDVAHKLALLPILNTVWDVIRIAKEQGQDLETVAKVYYGLNKALSFVWLRDQAKTMEPETRWEAETLKSVADRLYVTQAQLTKRIVREVCSGKKCPTNPAQDWIELNQDNVQPILDLVETMNEEQKIDFAMLTSVESRFSQLV
jgi:NAD-specific glutamate dehydrogenase